MLIDERLHAQQQKLQENVSFYLGILINLSKLMLIWNFIKMDTLREEYKCLESQLTESKRVEFADKELTQARIIIFQPKFRNLFFFFDVRFNLIWKLSMIKRKKKKSNVSKKNFIPPSFNSMI